MTSDHLSLSFVICKMGIKLMFVRMNEIVHVRAQHRSCRTVVLAMMMMKIRRQRRCELCFREGDLPV